MSPAVSVIVPVYNVEDWLAACLDSLQAQSETDWEAILVLDGPTDGSEAVAHDYAERDDRIRVIPTRHGGPGAARNAGLVHANGEYLAFLDADDLLLPGALESLLAAAREDAADVVVSSGDDLHDDGRRQRYWTQSDRLHRERARRLTVATHPRLLLDLVAWAKLYRRDWYREIGVRFPEGVHTEDMVPWVEAALAARSISVIPDVTCLHRRHEAAISADYLRERTLIDWIGQSTRAISIVRDLGGEEALRVYLDEFLTRQWLSRAREYDRLPAGDSAELFTQHARILRITARTARLDLPAHVDGLLDAIADGWAIVPPRAGGESLNPVTVELPKDGEGIRTRARRLHELLRTGRADRAWARAVFTEYILIPMARIPAAEAEQAQTDVARVLAELFPGPSRLGLIPGRRAKLGVLASRQWGAGPLVRRALAARRPRGERRRAVYRGRPVVFYPAWEKVNPFLTMLHLEARGRMRAVDGLANHYELLHWLRADGEPAVLHLHWTGPIVDRAADDAGAQLIVDEFLEALDRRLAAGSELIWTIHNVLPHDNAYPDAGRRLHAALAERARIIHILTEGTVAAVGEQYPLPPEKLRYIPHASYHGLYGAPGAPADARRRFRIADDATAVLFFGQIRPYKGLDVLADALIRRQASGQRIHLLVAGRPRDEDAVTGILDRLRSAGVAVTASLGFVAEADVADWFSAADVVALPYTRILNSGTVILAASYGVPVIVTRSAGIESEYGAEAWARLIGGEAGADEQTGGELAGQLADVLAGEWYRDAATRGAALAFAEGRSLLGMSRAYADLLDELDPATS